MPAAHVGVQKGVALLHHRAVQDIHVGLPRRKDGHT